MPVHCNDLMIFIIFTSLNGGPYLTIKQEERDFLFYIYSSLDEEKFIFQEWRGRKAESIVVGVGWEVMSLGILKFVSLFVPSINTSDFLN